MMVGRVGVCAYDNVSKGVSLPNTIRCVPSGALKIWAKSTIYIDPMFGYFTDDTAMRTAG